MVASGFRIFIKGRLCRWAISKSTGSWAGVILTAPVPKAGSTASSAIMGMTRFTAGRMTFLPTIALKALIIGIDGHGGIAEHGLGAGGGYGDKVFALSASG